MAQAPIVSVTGFPSPLGVNYSKRKEQVRQAVRRYRRRRQHGIYHRPIDITDAQLDALEERGYLDPERRGDRADESEVVEMFLMDSLTKPR